MNKEKLEQIEGRIKEEYQDRKEDHKVCGKYSYLLQVTRKVLEELGEDILVKRLRLEGKKLTHAVLWNDDTNLEVLFLVTEGENFIGCATWKIPEEDQNKEEIFEWKDHGDSKSRWLKQEYLQEALF